MSEETKKKISIAKLGTIPWNKGKHGYLSPETIARLSKLRKGQHLGSKSPRFTGTDIKHWKKQALLRDNFTCQICGLYDIEVMDVDHIKPQYLFPELNLVLTNLITLCANCHARKTRKERREWESKERRVKCEDLIQIA